MPTESHYRQVLDLSQRMLVAGMAQRWDELLALEQQRRALLDQAPVAPSSSGSRANRALISQIQECDSQLNEKLDAWMTHVRILLRMGPPPSTKS